MLSRPSLSGYSNGVNGFWPRPHDPTEGYFERTYRIGGLDLGQSSDPSTLAVIEKRVYGPDFVGPREERWRLLKLGAWPLGTDYGVVIADVLKLKTLEVLCIDATCQKPFVDWFRREASRVNWRTRVIPINIASSAMRESAAREKGYWSVPKRELVNALVVLEHQGNLVMDRDSPAVKQLLRQLADFKLTISRSAVPTFGAKAGSHDDLVLALSYCAWWGLRAGVRQPAIAF